ASLSFSYVDLNFDTSAHFVKDAFEAALLDDQGNSLVPTIGAGKDAFFNITEDTAAALGSTATLSGQKTVTLDLSGVFPGTAATLVFRLVNNDTDTDTSVRITQAQLPPGGSVGTTKFFVADPATDQVFRYGSTGTDNGPFAIDTAVPDPRGIASNRARDAVCVLQR